MYIIKDCIISKQTNFREVDFGGNIVNVENEE